MSFRMHPSPWHRFIFPTASFVLGFCVISVAISAAPSLTNFVAARRHLFAPLTELAFNHTYRSPNERVHQSARDSTLTKHFDSALHAAPRIVLHHTRRITGDSGSDDFEHPKASCRIRDSLVILIEYPRQSFGLLNVNTATWTTHQVPYTLLTSLLSPGMEPIKGTQYERFVALYEISGAIRENDSTVAILGAVWSASTDTSNSEPEVVLGRTGFFVNFNPANGHFSDARLASSVSSFFENESALRAFGKGDSLFIGHPRYSVDTVDYDSLHALYVIDTRTGSFKPVFLADSLIQIGKFGFDGLITYMIELCGEVFSVQSISHTLWNLTDSRPYQLTAVNTYRDPWLDIPRYSSLHSLESTSEKSKRVTALFDKFQWNYGLIGFGQHRVGVLYSHTETGPGLFVQIIDSESGHCLYDGPFPGFEHIAFSPLPSRCGDEAALLLALDQDGMELRTYYIENE